MPDELLDVVDVDNVVVGRELRSVVHQRGLRHRGVHAFLFTKEGKLLVQLRSKDRDTFPSAWDCSVSEHVKAGEDFFHAAVRGLREEIGIVGIELRPVVQYQMLYGPNDDEICQVYEGAVDPASVRFDHDEIERIAYHTLAELSAMLSTGEITFCSWFEQLILWHFDKPCGLHVIKIDQTNFRRD